MKRFRIWEQFCFFCFLHFGVLMRPQLYERFVSHWSVEIRAKPPLLFFPPKEQFSSPVSATASSDA
jgi:hypothetical protein